MFYWYFDEYSLRSIRSSFYVIKDTFADPSAFWKAYDGTSNHQFNPIPARHKWYKLPFPEKYNLRTNHTPRRPYTPWFKCPTPESTELPPDKSTPREYPGWPICWKYFPTGISGKLNL